MNKNVFLQIIVFVVFLTLPCIAQAEKVPYDASSAPRFKQLNPSLPYYCYRAPNSSAGSFGKVTARSGALNFSSLKGVALSKKIAALVKKLPLLKAAAHSTNLKVKTKAAKSLATLKREIKILKQGTKLCKGFLPLEATPTPTPQFIGEFSGHPLSLAPYRDQLTEAEVRNFLNKVAWGGNEVFVQIGLQQGLNALVEALFNFTPVEQPSRDSNTGVVSGLVQVPYNYLYQNVTPGGNAILGLTAHDFYAKNFWLFHLVGGNPIKETLLYNSYDWFTVNTAIGDSDYLNHCIREYVLRQRDHILLDDGSPLAGSFEQLLQDQNNDCAMLFFLDNRFNTLNTPNQNFGREFLELFTVGTADYISGAPTYGQDSVIAAMRASSGFSATWNGITGFDPTKHDSLPKTIFAGKPWEVRDRNLTYPRPPVPLAPGEVDLIAHILANNLEARRYIAGQWFTRLVHPSISRDTAGLNFLNQLSDTFANQDYKFKPFVKTLLKSEAMFSPEAYKPCVSSGAETFVRLVRQAKLPIRDHGSAPGGGNNGYNVENPSSLRALYSAIDGSGDHLLGQGSIFGKEYCGVWRGTKISKGEKNLNSQYWLERGNLFNELMKSLRDIEGFNFLELLPQPGASAEDTIAHFEKIFSVPLQPAERQVIATYAGNFSGLSSDQLKTKLMGLLRLFFKHSKFNLR